MNDSDLSTGKREMGGGLERYRFRLPATYFLSLAKRGGDVKQHIVNVYCISPRPDPREIVDVKVHIDKDTAHVDLLIQRGHYVLVRLIREHDEVIFNLAKGYAVCICCPGMRHPIVESSLPKYGSEF